MDALILGWCEGYMAIRYHMEEALIEKNLNINLARWDAHQLLYFQKNIIMK